MVSLFRLVELSGGRILLDGVDISTLGLDKLRQSMAIIPQDPILYSGTVRSNLDPFSQYSDEQIWDVLRKAYLFEHIEKLEGQLNGQVAESGDNFSVGQKCLVCLSSSSLLMRPDGSTVRAGDVVAGRTMLVGQEGEAVNVLSNQRAYSEVMYRIQYAGGQHTCTPNHLVPLRCCRSPYLSPIALAADGSHQLDLRWWDRASMTVRQCGWRFFLPDYTGPMPPKVEEDASVADAVDSRTLLPFRATVAQAKAFAFHWLNTAAARGLAQPMRNGDLADVPAEKLGFVLKTATARSQLRLPMLPEQLLNAEAADATMGCSSSVVADASSSGAAAEEEAAAAAAEELCLGDCDYTTVPSIDLPALVADYMQANDLEQPLPLVNTGRVVAHEGTPQERAKMDTAWIARECSNTAFPEQVRIAALSQLATLGENDAARQVCRVSTQVLMINTQAPKQSHLVVDGEQLAWTPLQTALDLHAQQAHLIIDTVYMLHNPLQQEAPCTAAGRVSAIEQLHRAWLYHKLTPTELRGVVLTELNPRTGEAGEMDSTAPRSTDICRTTMQASLAALPRTVLVFGRIGRLRWLSDARHLDGVLSATVQYDADAWPILLLHYAPQNDGPPHQITIRFAHHPLTAFRNTGLFMKHIAVAHGRTEKQLSDVWSTATVAVDSVVRTVGDHYNAIAIDAPHRRFVLADRVITHNCLARAMLKNSKILIMDEGQWTPCSVCFCFSFSIVSFDAASITHAAIRRRLSRVTS